MGHTLDSYVALLVTLYFLPEDKSSLHPTKITERSGGTVHMTAVSYFSLLLSSDLWHL